MPVIYMDSFDHYDSPTLKWNTATAAAALSTTQKRTGTQSMKMTSAGGCTKGVTPCHTIIVGMAIYVPNGSSYYSRNSGQVLILGSANGAVNGYETGFALQSDGRVAVVRATLAGWDDIIVSTNPCWAEGIWNYFEFKSSLGDSENVTVRVNKGEVMNTDGLNTSRSTETNYNSVRLAGQLIGQPLYYDDLYVVDADNPAADNSDFLGDVIVQCAYPTGVGTNSGLTSSSGNPNYTNVDEAIGDAADYNSGTTLGLKDSYPYDDLTPGYTPMALQLCLDSIKDDIGDRSIKGLCISGGVEYLGSDELYLSNNRFIQRQIWDRNPNGAVWTKVDIDSLEFGAEIIS